MIDVLIAHLTSVRSHAPELVAPEVETVSGAAHRDSERLGRHAFRIGQFPAGAAKALLNLICRHPGVHGRGLGRSPEPMQQQRRSRRGSLGDAGDVGGPAVFGQGVEAAIG